MTFREHGPFAGTPVQQVSEIIKERADCLLDQPAENEDPLSLFTNPNRSTIRSVSRFRDSRGPHVEPSEVLRESSLSLIRSVFDIRNFVIRATMECLLGQGFRLLEPAQASYTRDVANVREILADAVGEGSGYSDHSKAADGGLILGQAAEEMDLVTLVGHYVSGATMRRSFSVEAWLAPCWLSLHGGLLEDVLANLEPMEINLALPLVERAPDRFKFLIDASGFPDQLSFVPVDLYEPERRWFQPTIINAGAEAVADPGSVALTDPDSYQDRWLEEGDFVYRNLRIWTVLSNGMERLVVVGQTGVGAVYLGRTADSHPDISTRPGALDLDR